MKKIISALLLFFYLSANTAFAESELYYLKNIKTDSVAPYVDDSFIDNAYNVIKKNPYYAISQKNGEYTIVILQQSGENMFYYFNSENSNKVNKQILKEIKKSNIICEQSFNQSIIDIYDNIAQNLIQTSGAVKQYSFDEPVNAFEKQETTAKAKQNNTYRGYVTQLNAGTKVSVYLQNAINTASASKGDQVIAVVQNDLKVNNITIIPQGSVVYGVLSNARNASYGSRNGRVVIKFNQIVTPEDKVYDISAEEIDFTVTNEGKVSEAAKSALKSAAAGAVLGLLFALLSDNNAGRAAAIGAGVGAGSSVIYSAAERGVDAEIPSFTELEITLTSPVSISVGL